MDFLGKKGEKAEEAVQNLSGRIEDLESHLNAVDNAVQGVREESRQTDLEVAEENRERLEEVEELLMQMLKIQENSMRDIDEEDGRETKLERKLNAINQKLRRYRQDQEQIQDRLERLDEQLNMKMDKIEKKVFRVEDELTSDIELNEARIEAQTTEEEFNEEISDIREEMSRLRTSIRAVASELDDDKIRVE